MYLDHPSISATNSDTEPDRVERLNRVYGYAIALADADGNAGTITRLMRLHDHKGNLIVQWRDAPSETEKAYFSRAWHSLIGDRSQNVSHELNDQPL